MSEIRLILNPDSCNVEKIQLIADDEEMQEKEVRNLQKIMGLVNRFSQEAVKQIYRKEPLCEKAPTKQCNERR